MRETFALSTIEQQRVVAALRKIAAVKLPQSSVKAGNLRTIAREALADLGISWREPAP
jgi:hypothetical protein